MPSNTVPIFGKTPIGNPVLISAANANRTDTSAVTIYTAGASGAVIFGISIKAIVSTTTGLVRIFVNSGLIWEEVIPAITVSATQFAYEGYIGRKIILPAGGILKANTEKAESFYITPNGFDYE